MRFTRFTIALAVSLALAATPAGAAVVLNEINCEGLDWVELVNTGDEPAPVGGLLLTDDPLDVVRAKHRMILPAGTTIEAGGRLTVEKGEQGFPFGISCGDDTIRLADPQTNIALDTVVVPELGDPQNTWGRYPDGTGAWTETAATRDAPNVLPATGSDPGPADESGLLFDPDRVARVELTLPPESEAALDADPYTYVPGTISLTAGDRDLGPYQVGLRLKGHSTFEPLDGRPSFKIKLDSDVPGQRLLGLRKLTLNSMVADPTMVRETLAYELFRALDVPAPRTGYAFVRVNGADYGVYLSLEPVDTIMLARWFPSTLHLYEAEGAADMTPELIAGLSVDEGDAGDLGDLAPLVAAAEAPDSGALAAVSDLDELIRMWAVERYIGHWDGYAAAVGLPHNYFLHSDTTGRFSMLPWGTDQTWRWYGAFDDDSGGLLFRLCRRDRSCASRYREALARVGGQVDALDLGHRRDSILDTIAPWRSLDPRRRETPEEAAAAIAELRAFMVERRRQLTAWLDPTGTQADSGPLPDANTALPDASTRVPGGDARVPNQTARTLAPAMSVGRHEAGTKQLYTNVRVATRGTVSIRVLARVGRSTQTLCSARATADVPGVLALRCVFSQASARLRAGHSVRVTVETVLRTRSGVRETRRRPTTLPRLRTVRPA